MFREAGSFFAIALVLLVGACVYIESQGGNPFGNHPVQVSTCTSQDYRCIARQDATNAGINPDYFERQINEESGFNPNAVSSAGAIGIAQILPSTAHGWGVDPHDPVASLQAASKAMAWYQNKYGSFNKALACYNAGCSTLVWAEQNCTNYYYCLPQQTRTYIDIITGAHHG